MEKILEVERGAEGEWVVHFRPPRGLPQPAREHLGTARKEFLLGLRSLVDACLKREEKEKKGPTKIEVQ